MFTLKEFTSPTAQFYGVPVYVTRADGSRLDAFFQAPEGEGHEIFAEVNDSLGRAAARGKHLFKEAHGSVSLTLPQSVPPNANLAFKDAASSTILASAATYADGALGVSQLRQWYISGRAQAAENLNAGEALIGDIEWNVFVTQSWLNTTSPEQLTIEPFVIQKEDPKKPGVLIDQFKKQWNFRADSPLTWQLHYYVGASDYGKVLDHVMNQSYYDGMVYGEAIQYSP
jgi:hypothetical protein